MNIVQIIAAAIGFLIIAVVLWNMRGHRRHDGSVEEPSDVWLNNDWPG